MCWILDLTKAFIRLTEFCLPVNQQWNVYLRHTAATLVQPSNPDGVKETHTRMRRAPGQRGRAGNKAAARLFTWVAPLSAFCVRQICLSWLQMTRRSKQPPFCSSAQTTSIHDKLGPSDRERKFFGVFRCRCWRKANTLAADRVIKRPANVKGNATLSGNSSIRYQTRSGSQKCRFGPQIKALCAE